MTDNIQGYSTPIFPATGGEDKTASEMPFEIEMPPFGYSNLNPEGRDSAEETAEEEPVTEEPVTEGPAEEEPATEEPVEEEPATEEPASEEPVEEEAAEETTDPMAEILVSLAAMNSKMEEMQQLFVRRIARTDAEEKITDQMHAELQRYKEDMYTQLIRPVLLDIIDIRDSIVRITAVYAEKPEEQRNIPLAMFSDYGLSMLDILEKYNVFAYSGAPGEDYKAIRQRVIKKVPTGDQSLHGKVAKSLGSGYEYMGKVITPEPVEVYVYDPELNLISQEEAN